MGYQDRPHNISTVLITSGQLKSMPVFLCRLTNEESGIFSAPSIDIKRTGSHRLFFHIPHMVTWASKF